MDTEQRLAAVTSWTTLASGQEKQNGGALLKSKNGFTCVSYAQSSARCRVKYGGFSYQEEPERSEGLVDTRKHA